MTTNEALVAEIAGHRGCKPNACAVATLTERLATAERERDEWQRLREELAVTSERMAAGWHKDHRNLRKRLQAATAALEYYAKNGAEPAEAAFVLAALRGEPV